MKKILLAEDDRISRVMLQAVLQKWGYQVESAGNGQEALAKLLDPDGPSLAILDWMMPVLDGLEVCRQVRDSVGLRHVHIILLTSKSKGADAAAAMNVGADDHVSKPYDLLELQARIELGFRRIRWARDCSTGYLRPQQIQGLMEVNRLAMLQAMRGRLHSTSDSPRACPLRDTLERVERCMGGGLRTTVAGVKSGPEPMVAMERTALEQLLANLYSHWQAAMPSGGTVEISCGEVTEGKVRLTCLDDGPPVSDVQILSGALLAGETQQISTGMGILFAKAMAESCGGALSWSHPSDEKGLLLEIDLPIHPG
ncbi:MAG: response regulator [Fibrobacteres bacterium]|nr:response regulator [Fibrobacterota bacterium]